MQKPQEAYPCYPQKLSRLKSQITATKHLLSSPRLASQEPEIFLQASEQLKQQEGLLKQVESRGVLCRL